MSMCFFHYLGLGKTCPLPILFCPKPVGLILCQKTQRGLTSINTIIAVVSDALYKQVLCPVAVNVTPLLFHPPDPYTLELQNPSNDIPEPNKIRQSPDVEAPKL